MAEVVIKTHKRVQFARNTTAVLNAYIGAIGELNVDTTRMELRLHDGKKKGGWRFLSSTAMQTLFLSVDSEAGNIRFQGSGQFGFLTRVADKVYKVRTLKVDDGLTLSNPRGIDGDPVLGLPPRLQPISTDLLTTATAKQDCNLLVQTGFYALKADTTNLPVGVAELSSSVLIVIARSNTEIVQFICNNATGQNVWTRAMIAGAWQEWNQLRPSSGSKEVLLEGTDTDQRTWTAAQLNELITERLKDIGTETEAGTVSTYGASQKKFNESFKGPSIGEKTFGPYGSPTDKERWIIYVNVTPKVERQGGSGGTDRQYGGDLTVEAEIDGSWKKVLEIPNQNGSPVASPVPKDKMIKCLFQYDASSGSEKMLTCNSDWVTLSNQAGEWNGKLKFSTSSQTTAMSITGYKFKLKT